MEIRLDSKPKPKNVLLVSVKGKIAADSVQNFKQQLETLINEGNTRIMLKFKEVSYINSLGLGVLTSMLRLTKKENGDIKLFDLNPSVKDIFNATRLNKVFEIYDSEEEALKAF
jgi:anti-sigma B factor antagonist